MTIKVELPNGIKISGDTRDDLKEIFAYVESLEEPVEPECKRMALPTEQYKIWCVVNDFPGSHSGIIAKVLNANKASVSNALSSLKNIGAVIKRTDGHYGWLVAPGVEAVEA